MTIKKLNPLPPEKINCRDFCRDFISLHRFRPKMARARCIMGRHTVTAGPLAGLSLNREAKFVEDAMRLYDRLGKKNRKWWRDQIAAITTSGPGHARHRDDDDDDGPEETTGLAPGASVDRMRKRKPHIDERDRRVSNDRRTAAFDADVDVLMPLNNENLYKWQSWLPGKLQIHGAAWPYWCGIRGFLERGLLRKKFGELDWREKTALWQLVRTLVEVNAQG
jgi:hypothetical protein